MIDFIEWDNPMLYVVWAIGMIIIGYMLKTLTARPEMFPTSKLIMMGVIAAPVLLIVAQIFLTKMANK